MNRIRRAEMLVGVDRYEMAAKLLTEELSEDPLNADTEAYLGIVYGHLKDFEAAHQALDSAIGNDPDNAYCYYAKAYVLSEQENWGESILCCYESMRISPEDPDCLCLLAHCKFMIAKYEEALKAARDGLKINPEHMYCLANEAWALVSLGRHEQAREVIKRGLAINPEFAKLHSCAAYLEQRRGEFDVAAERYQVSVQIDPTEAWERDQLQFTSGIKKSLVFKMARLLSRICLPVKFWYYFIDVVLLLLSVVLVVATIVVGLMILS